MRTTLLLSSWAWMGGIVWVSVLLAGLAWAGASETKDTPREQEKTSAPAPAEQAQDGDNPVGHIGTIVAVSQDMRTVVVDIALEKGVLRVGAEVTGETMFTEGGKRIGLEQFNPGDRVRLRFKRVPHGDLAVSLERLAPAGQ